jgi:hypothetical protein
MLRPGFELVKPEDIAIPRCVDSADEAIAIVREHHARWRAGKLTVEGARGRNHPCR